MKKRILLLLLCAATLLSTAACAKERHDLLHTVTVGTYTFDVRGTEDHAKQVVVKQNGKFLWSKSLKIDKSVGHRNGSYGFVATDLNFDGLTDFMIADKISGECVSYLCYLATNDGPPFVYSEDLSSLYNIQTNPEKQVLFAFSHNTEEISNRAYTVTDTTTQYIWKDGELTPERHLSLCYYSETEAYCLSAAIYNPETQQFDMDIEGFSDKWFFSEESLKDYDLSTLYYFR